MVVRPPKCLQQVVNYGRLTIESDASKRGWEATCEGTRTGPWSPEGSKWHINSLEVLAAFHGLKFCVRDRRSITVLLNLDNTPQQWHTKTTNNLGVNSVHVSVP